MVFISWAILLRNTIIKSHVTIEFVVKFCYVNSVTGRILFVFCFLCFSVVSLPVRKSLQAVFISSQPYLSPLRTKSMGRAPRKLRLYTSKERARTFKTTWMPSGSSEPLVRFLHSLNGPESTGVKHKFDFTLHIAV